MLTPGGNWSSYPPHKHDEVGDTESVLEEIYYYEVARNGPAYQRVYGTAGLSLSTEDEAAIQEWIMGDIPD